MARTSVLAAGLAVAAVSSCGGPAAQALRPDDPTYSRAVGVACTSVDGDPQPLIVDLRPEARADLEVSMRRGVAVVAYDCASLRVLPDCTVAGGYRFIGVTYKDQKLHLKTADEIKANLPSGMIAASFGSEIKRDAAIDVQLSIVGKQMASVSDATQAQLQGHCTGATHLVRAVTTGAFTLDTDTGASVDAALAVAGVGGSTKGTSDKQWHHQDGDRAACVAASPDATAPPAGCSASLRLDLVTLGAAARAVPEANGDPAARLASSPARGGGCPSGLVWSAGICRESRADAPHKCQPDDVDGCRRQCDLGDAASCTELGFAHLVGRTVALDRRRATELFVRACDGGDLHGCNDLGAMLISRDAVPIPELRRAIKLFEDVCAQEPTLCTNLAVMYRDGLHTAQRPTRAAELFSRACLGGNATACHDLALAYDKGVGVGRDVPRAAELQLQSCRGGFMHACAALGTRYLYGQGVERDEPTAVRYYQHACDHGNQLGCGLYGLLMMEGTGGLPRDPRGGRRRMEQACDSGSNDVCAILGLALRTQGDVAGARQWLRRACDGGMTEHCN